MITRLSQCLHVCLELSRQSCTNAVFDSVITLCEYRIHGRLESNNWTRPRHQSSKKKKRPLHQALRKYCLTLKGVRSNASKSMDSLQDQLIGLCSTYEAVDRCSNDSSKRVAAIKLAVQQSYGICTSGGKCSIQTTIAAHGLNSGQMCKERVIRQVNKIGRYWGLCIDMAEDSRRYPNLFSNISLDFSTPYTRTSSKVHSNAITKGFVKCRVHAEIQLLVCLDQRGHVGYLRPRVIGVNKAACYLCNLFFLTHGLYFITKTHGRLYEQWTVPDLEKYSIQQRHEYRRIVSSMIEVLETAAKSQPKQKRVDPMQSYVCLPTPPGRSPLPSYAATIISDAALNTFQPPRHNPPTPRASPIGLTNAPQVKSSPIASVHPSPVQTSPAPSVRSVKHPRSQSPTPSLLGTCTSTPSAHSNSYPKPLSDTAVQPYHLLKRLQSRSRKSSPLGSSISNPSAYSNNYPMPANTTPIQPYHTAKHSQSRSRTPSPLGSSPSTLSPPSDSSPKPLHTIPVQPSSQILSPRESASQKDSHQDLEPTRMSDATHAPGNTVELQHPNSWSSSSTISHHPLNTPLSQIITATHPLRLSAPGLYTTVEMEGSVRGEVTVLHPDAEDEISATVIDVDSLKPGESMTLVKEEYTRGLNLVLCRRRAEHEEHRCRLELSWMS